MGIPSYFSFIIKNHPEILTTLQTLQQSPQTHTFHHLFFDANSIIYDAFHAISKDPHANVQQENVFFERLSQAVILKIESYIQFVSPTHTLFIAFDGIPPTAKIVQQRSRRFKSKHLEQMTHQLLSIPTTDITTELQTTPFPWQTSIITPGTPFMNFLSKRLEQYFQTKMSIRIQILSTANEPGEGEHKIFHYLRQNPPKPSENVAIYGLDSDLIMLSLLSVPNIFIFREAPAFMSIKIDKAMGKTRDKSHTFDHTKLTPKMGEKIQETEESYFLDINRFRSAIQDTIPKPYDYVFMCYLLGNDFLPHISCLNLRTNGLHTLLKHYRNVKPTLIHPITQEIQWKELERLLKPIAQEERELLIQEFVAFEKQPYPKYGASNGRQNQTQNSQPPINKTDLQEYIQTAPYLFSYPIRNYIQPMKENWQQRYRKAFATASPQGFLKQMEETWNYYLGKKSDLECYVSSPPLVTDLVQQLSQTHLLSSVQPLFTLSFQTNQDYLNYVLSSEPLAYHFGFEKFLWETHCH